MSTTTSPARPPGRPLDTVAERARDERVAHLVQALTEFFERLGAVDRAVTPSMATTFGATRLRRVVPSPEAGARGSSLFLSDSRLLIFPGPLVTVARSDF